ncbi:hypothetical protein ABT369_25445 [Dactylosporangium sp. NPDC000244]|uniref:hypothetical protein n=1 Tax=Dactylosporangium sp. NPDC000244 TaxID=3154365 RepID=UPI00332923F0
MMSVLTLPIERYRVMAHIDGEFVAPGDGGIDVFEALLPVNRFLAGPTPSTVPIASCPSCGFEDWHDDATIVRDGDLVRWTFRDRSSPSPPTPTTPRCAGPPRSRRWRTSG